MRRHLFVQREDRLAVHAAVGASKNFGLASAFRTDEHDRAGREHACPEIDADAYEQGDHADNHEHGGNHFAGLAPENDARRAKNHNPHSDKDEDKPPQAELVDLAGFK